MLDIVPPTKGPNNQKRTVQKSQRLRGHSLDDARARLFGATSMGLNSPQTAHEQNHQPVNSEGSNNGEPEQVAAKKRLSMGRPRPMDWWRAWSKKRKFITVLFILLLIGGGVAFAASSQLLGKAEPELVITKNKKIAPPAPTTVASPLSGVQVSPAEAARPVTGIMIENSPDARPQSGLQEAGVIFEAIAEGGITRFLTLYQETRPGYIGPVRSLRPYYIDFAGQFDAPIAHVGGSPDALAQIRNGGKDLDQFFNSGSYWRISSRYAPHNVYTNFDKLDALNTSKGYTSSNVKSWARKKEKKLVTTTAKSTSNSNQTQTPPAPTAAKIDMAISSALYNSHYDYDAATNSYARSEGGAPHMAITDEAGNTTQLKPKVVIALIVPYSIVDSSGHSGYSINGSGTGYIFQDGGVTQITWSKADRYSPIEFKDSAGNIVPINPGQTWVTLLASPDKLTYTP